MSIETRVEAFSDRLARFRLDFEARPAEPPHDAARPSRRAWASRTLALRERLDELIVELGHLRRSKDLPPAIEAGLALARESLKHTAEQLSEPRALIEAREIVEELDA